MTESKKIIFIVDDNDSILAACKQVLKSQYIIYPVLSAAKMFDLLEHIIPDLILLDVEMPEMNGLDAAKALKTNPRFNSIPVIFLSGHDDVTNEIEGLNLGALDYIHKPFVGALLVRRIENHLSLYNRSKANNAAQLPEDDFSRLSQVFAILLANTKQDDITLTITASGQTDTDIAQTNFSRLIELLGGFYQFESEPGKETQLAITVKARKTK